MGKSALALNIATECARVTKKTVLFFSLEMNVVELAERVYANYASLDLHRIRDAKLTGEQWTTLVRTAHNAAQIDVRIIESPSLDMSAVTRLCRRTKPSLVIVDHIGLIRPSKRHRDRREAMDELSRSLKCMAKDLYIPVLALAQLNREITRRTNKTPMLSDLRESGAIEQDADVVMFVDRPAYYDNQENKKEAKLVIAKNRHGKTDDVPLLWIGSNQRFVDDWTKGEQL